MKKMILNFMMICAASTLMSASAFAAIACKPGMNNCPGAPGDGPHPTPQKPTKATGSGYYEVASPQCLEEEMQLAKQGAEARAYFDAQRILGSKNIKQTSPSKFLVLKCEQSIYAGSFQGNSWIVYVVADYSL